MKKLLPLIALLLALILAGTAVAQTNATAAITADRADATVGDPIHLTVTVTHPAGTQAIFPQLDQQWGDFLVRQQSPVTTVSNADGSLTSTQTVDVRLFAPGAFLTPPLTITLADAGGQTSEINAAPINVTIQSVLVEGDTSLRDIKPQAALPFPASWPWMAAGLAAVAAVVVWFIYRRAKIMLDNRLPHEVALAVLADVERQQLAANGRFKTHYSLITDALRAYVEQTQGIPATDRTTRELKSELARTTLTERQAQQLLAVLEAGDLVKFARVTPTLAEAQTAVSEARQFIEETKPAPAAEETAKKKDGRPAAKSPVSNLQSSTTEARP